MRNIFISYRREDSFAYAGRIYDHLANHFGKQNVFMDVDNIDLGLDFVEVLQQTVSSCSAMVVVIGKQWLTAADEDGHRRLDNPEDLVRIEVATALDRKIRVLPVLVSGARMPRSQDLPENLAALSRRNALDIFDTSFHESVERLIESLERILPPAETANCPPPPPRRESSPAVSAPPPKLSFAAKAFLFYRPAGPPGWVFRILYYWFLLATLGGAAAPTSDPGLVGVMAIFAGCSWWAARWFDEREMKKRAARVS